MVIPNYLSGSEALCDVSEHPCFYSVRLLASRQTPKLEDYSWSAVHDCLFNIVTFYSSLLILTEVKLTYLQNNFPFYVVYTYKIELSGKYEGAC